MTDKKLKAVYFGASKGGQRGFRHFKNQYEAIGFSDNDVQKHGTKFCGLPVYAPEQLKELDFDIIIICSMYHDEIQYQLVRELGIPYDKVDILEDSILNDDRKMLIGCMIISITIIAVIGYAGYRLFMWMTT